MLDRVDFMDECSESLVLHISSGLHEGGRARIREHVKYRIGTDVEGDIVLRDEGVAARHVTFEVSEGCVKLEAYAESVLIDGSRKLPPGHIAESRLPSRFSIGSVQLCLDSDGSGLERWGRSPDVVRPRLEYLRAYAWPLVLVFFGVMVVYLLLSGPGAAKDTLADAVSDAAPGTALAPSASEVQRALQIRLQAAGLQDMTVRAEGSLVEVQGVLPVYRKGQWQEVQEWFDLNYGAHFLLKSEMAAMEAPKVVITAVWLGERPYIVDANGERHYQGAMLHEGWMLQSVGEGRIVLVRNGQEHVFNL